MFQHNFFTYSGKIVLKIIGDIFYFPIWWYSVGLVRLLRNIWNFLRNKERSIGLFIWIKNIFVPMYGQRDWAGRLISFVMRLVQIVFRSLILFIWVVLSLVLIIIWLLGPVFIIIALALQILH